jgi:WD40 repeat protein
VSDDKSVRLWDTATGECIHVFAGPEEGFGSVAFSLQGDLVVIAAHKTTMWLMDIESAECLHMLCDVDKVAHSPQGGMVASGSSDGTVRLWDIESEECLHILVGHTMSGVRFVQFSPHGDQIASTSEDGTIRLWEVASGQCIAAIQEHTHINSIAWSTGSDVDYLVAGFNDGSVSAWQVTDDGNSHHACLRWRTTKGGLSVKNTLIQDARGLNQEYRKLLVQRGAVGDPITDPAKQATS